MATRGHVAAEPLDKTLADTLPHVETETLDDRLDDVKGKALVVVVLADVAAKVEAKTLDKTVGQIETIYCLSVCKSGHLMTQLPKWRPKR